MSTRSTVETLTLLQTSDSAFPSGAFAFSHGLETLASEGRVAGAPAVEAVLLEQVLPRWLGFDRWFLARAHEVSGAAEPDALNQVDALCEAHNAVASLVEASRRIGRSTLVTHARLGTPGAAAFRDRIQAGAGFGHAPVVQGALARALGLAVGDAATGALFACMSASVSAAVRLGVLGALDAQRLLLAMRGPMAEGLAAPMPDSPAAFSPLIDIAAMRHAMTETRLFAA